MTVAQFAASAARSVESVDAIVARLRPEDPVICFRPRLIEATARRFVAGFPGQALYAVKSNPAPEVITALVAGGFTGFDVASIEEVALVRGLAPHAFLAFMNPVKTRTAIRRAYFEYGVRDFSLDTMDELQKILDETDGATDLGLHVRLGLPKGNAICDLSGKFGVPLDEAPELLRAVRAVAHRAGICFHVGSQNLDPQAWTRAIEIAGDVAARAGVVVDVLDVGGGYPVSYTGYEPPPLERFFEAIAEARGRLFPHAAVWGEPGRVMVGASTSLVVQVMLRRGDRLHLTDGTYGSLADGNAIQQMQFPVRLIRTEGGTAAPLAEFTLFGPTCDSTDKLHGRYLIPADVREGDWLELGQIGAYGPCLRTGFNGFGRAIQVEVEDAPLLSTPGHPAPVGETAQPFFFFGSLMDQDLLRVVLAREVTGLEMVPATLHGFRRRRALDEAFPIIQGHPGGRVEGMLVHGLAQADIARLRFYESGDYETRPFDVEGPQGRVRAQVFVATGRLEDAGVAWEFDAWVQEEKPLGLLLAGMLMDLFGKASFAEIEAAWPAIKARAAVALAESAESGSVRRLAAAG
ncbi:gamma-glutamylcyclotransferase [Zavarzinia sp. CC-PAN008]|uniref:gamma-glutamylcyclotransferase n=1 Tax=Zavarzinia sp. CC-PAN008 TaxID=3243332 RepID=UPI003F748A42